MSYRSAETGHTELAAPNDEFASDAQLATFMFHDRLAVIGADTPVIPSSRSGRVLTPSVRLILLSDPLVRPCVRTHAGKAAEQPVPGPHALSAKSTPTSHLVGQPYETT